MGSMKAEASALRKLARELKNGAGQLTSIGSSLKSVEGWPDKKGQEFLTICQETSRLVTKPVQTLTSSAERLEKLAWAIDAYQAVKFRR